MALIVITFGASQQRVGLAALAAGASIVVVVGIGFVLRAPLARVPENALKLTVGVLLTAFGTFWSAEGVGAQWPAGEAALPLLIALALGACLLITSSLRKSSGTWTIRGGSSAPRSGRLASAIGFFIGDDWLVAAGVIAALALTALLSNVSPAWYPMPVTMLALLWLTVARRARTTPTGLD